MQRRCWNRRVTQNAEVIYTYGVSEVFVGGTKPENSSSFTMGDTSLAILPAQFRQTRAPEYPEEAKRQNARGSVTIFVTAMPTGDIHDAHVALSSGNPLLGVSGPESGSFKPICSSDCER
ncbi:MAG: energy transducer TonB [Candidatus Eremiobacteraeota bacterium]|nr:energy transducer TonB [Candidatus Eremiobacteraeota bacterium]